LQALPRKVQDGMGYALFLAQCGGTPLSAKPLSGFGGRGVLEIVENFDGNAYRAVYTVSFRKRFMCCALFRRNRRKALPRQSRKLT
jgi:phage-related protein